MLLPNNEFLATAAKIAAEMGIQAYLVGGGPRDMVMGRDISDFDFALDGEPELFPRLFARTIGGTFFWLDEQRLQSRVVRPCDAGVMTFDCAPLRGAGIDGDLSLRDFTINALAIPLAAAEVSLIDPLGALRDIRQGVIRACSDACFDDDPLRLLRALRFAATLGFAIEPGTWRAIGEKARLLHRVAAERIRDEFFRILATPDACPSLARLHESGLLAAIFPSLSITPEQTAGSFVERLERVHAVQACMADLVSAPSPFTENIHECLSLEVEAGITVGSLVKLGVFLGGDYDQKMVAMTVGRLRPGARTLRVLEILCAYAGTAAVLRHWKPTERAMYRFFRDREPVGLASLIVSVAGGLVSARLCSDMVDFYFNHYPAVRDDSLLSGEEIMGILGVPPGRPVGEGMRVVKEAESIGLVNSKTEAVDYLGKNLLTKDDPVR